MAWILIVFLILLGGLIAPFGDLLGSKIGKARFSILKLRPKKTATIVTIITGGFISAISIGLLLLVSEEFRQRLFVDIPFLQKTLDESKKALIPLQEERKKLEDKINNKENELNKLKSDVKEFRRGNVVIKRGQTLFIAEVTSNSNIKLNLGKIYNSADKYVQKIVIPSKREIKNILLWRPSDIAEIEEITAKGGNWIIVIKSATNILKGDNFVFVYPELLVNKIIVRRGEVVTSEILEKNELDYKNINSTIKTLLRRTRDEIKLRGSIVNEITTRGDFIKKIRDSLKNNPNIKYQLEVVSLKDSKTADSIIVELNITELYICMLRLISIDPGKYKCGLVLAERTEKIVYEAIILESNLLADYVRHLDKVEDISSIIIGNGTNSREIRKKLFFFEKEIITFEEKNTTYRAKARYFELFPISGLKYLVPREIFILNKNLDAISALIILEDYCKMKFTLNQNIDFKTWLK